MPRPLRKLITVAVLAALAYIAHLTRLVVPTTYRALPDMAAALLIGVIALVVLAPLLNKRARV